MNANTYMKWEFELLILVILLIPGTSGCSGSSSSVVNSDGSGLFTNNTLVVEKVTRTYDYYVPGDLSSSLTPLVFLLHGGGSKAGDLTGESGFKAPYKIWMDIADAEKFILVYPQGSINPLNAPGWNDCRADATSNPLSMMSALLTR